VVCEKDLGVSTIVCVDLTGRFTLFDFLIRTILGVMPADVFLVGEILVLDE
jgi:hypothetical protein